MRKKALSKTPMTVWRVLIYLFLFLFMAACLFPLLYEVLLSVSSRDDFLNARFLVFPHHFNLEMYKLILFQDSIGRSFLISIVVTITSTLYSMLLLSFGAYALIKENLPGQENLLYAIADYDVFRRRSDSHGADPPFASPDRQLSGTYPAFWHFRVQHHFATQLLRSGSPQRNGILPY